jgi:TPR repeat protein
MPTRTFWAIFFFCLALVPGETAHAAGPPFDDLLAKANAEIAAGHRWEPAGDNLAETIMDLLQLVPNATQQQLADLNDLLERERKLGQPALTARQADPAASPATRPSTPETAFPATTTSMPEKPSVSASLEPVPAPRPAVHSADPHAAELFARGKAAEQNGDISGARRLYASAAARGNAAAALGLGRLYDPAFLGRSVLGGVDPDPTLARQWYQRAADMGDLDAAPLLQALTTR